MHCFYFQKPSREQSFWLPHMCASNATVCSTEGHSTRDCDFKVAPQKWPNIATSFFYRRVLDLHQFSSYVWLCSMTVQYSCNVYSLWRTTHYVNLWFQLFQLLSGTRIHSKYLLEGFILMKGPLKDLWLLHDWMVGHGYTQHQDLSIFMILIHCWIFGYGPVYEQT